uniref:RNase H type-1 domain-containing protein n=1 Tax=viral metagenome TaxID=1070528 RepID=A0A6C0FCH9_9ZZZZ|tara:strand:+ start:109 stop:525 length:417 start_codon:yes stop_codon:yes gene_type:complete
MTSNYILFFDGCSKGNPGESGAGAVIFRDDKEIYTESFFVGDRETNNVAEYTGLIMGLSYAVDNNMDTLVVKGDSNLVIRQMKGEFQVKSPKLMPYYQEARKLSDKIKNIRYEHVYRDNNKRADELANNALLLKISEK